MFDVRYHGLSLAAVFIALVVGLLLGVAIGDRELVSSARNEIRDSLRADVRQAGSERNEARAELAREREFSAAAYPILADGRLAGRRIGLVLLGDEPDAPDAVRDALEPTGAILQVVAVVREDIDTAAVADRARGTQYAAIDRNAGLLDDLGRRVGTQIVEGGRLVGELRSTLLESLSGEFGGLDGVVVMRSPSAGADEATAARLDALHDGIARGLAQTGVSVVGIEPRDSDPSYVGWYRERELSSVDNVDEMAGRAALVFVLAGAEGAFGRRDSAQALLPPVVGRSPER
jgi:hypothetical protein